MKKGAPATLSLMALLAAAVSASAFEIQYDGLARYRFLSTSNIKEGTNTLNGCKSRIGEHIGLYLKYLTGENLSLTAGFEQDIVWGTDPKHRSYHPASQFSPHENGSFTGPGAFAIDEYDELCSAKDPPKSLWTFMAGVAWQVADNTRISADYLLLGAAKNTLAGVGAGETHNIVGHEADLYLDQKVVDGLMFRLIAAYLFPEDTHTMLEDGDDAYQLGARLQWAF